MEETLNEENKNVIHSNVIFKKEGNIFYKLEHLFWICWSKDFFRFLFAGGLNTLIGLIITITLRWCFDTFGWQVKLGIESWKINGYELMSFDLPSMISFVVGLPIAYTNQTIIAFKVKWNFKAFIRYPLSSIPNFILQQLCILIFEIWIGVPSTWSYIISAALPLPIMFFIIRFLVNPIKLKKKEN